MWIFFSLMASFPIYFFITLITSPHYTPPLTCIFPPFSAGQITGFDRQIGRKCIALIWFVMHCRCKIFYRFLYIRGASEIYIYTLNKYCTLHSDHYISVSYFDPVIVIQYKFSWRNIYILKPLSQVRICNPPPPPFSEMLQFSWRMCNVLIRIIN